MNQAGGSGVLTGIPPNMMGIPTPSMPIPSLPLPMPFPPPPHLIGAGRGTWQGINTSSK
jgi:hypothetical protein